MAKSTSNIDWGEAVLGNPLQEIAKLEQLKMVGMQNRLNQMALGAMVMILKSI